MSSRSLCSEGYRTCTFFYWYFLRKLENYCDKITETNLCIIQINHSNLTCVFHTNLIKWPLYIQWFPFPAVYSNTGLLSAGHGCSHACNAFIPNPLLVELPRLYRKLPVFSTFQESQYVRVYCKLLSPI